MSEAAHRVLEYLSQRDLSLARIIAEQAAHEAMMRHASANSRNNPRFTESDCRDSLLDGLDAAIASLVEIRDNLLGAPKENES